MEKPRHEQPQTKRHEHLGRGDVLVGVDVSCLNCTCSCPEQLSNRYPGMPKRRDMYGKLHELHMSATNGRHVL